MQDKLLRHAGLVLGVLAVINIGFAILEFITGNLWICAVNLGAAAYVLYVLHEVLSKRGMP